MPVEIKELHIKINVDENPRTEHSGKLKQKEKEQIVAACIEQVMNILSKNEER